MACHIREKALALLGEIRLEETQPPPFLSLSLSSLPLLAPCDEVIDGCVLDGVLSISECNRFITCSESAGFSFWDASGRSDSSLKVRSADTLEFNDPVLCAQLWERLRHFVPQHVRICEDQQRYEPDLEGSWTACGLNSHLLVNKYGPGGHFAPHVDGSTIVDFNHRSLYTVLVYLNDCDEGGATQLLRAEQGEATESDLSGVRSIARESFVAYAVRPICGRALIYWHEVLHAGEPVGPTSMKYCLRTDVMYVREPPICIEPNDLLAFDLLQEARRLEGMGRATDALSLLMKVRRLSRGIATAYRIV